MRSITRIAAAHVILLLLLTTACTSSKWPPQSIGDLMRHVQQARGKDADAMRKQIADGPQDLAREKAALAADGISLTPANVKIPEGQDTRLAYDKWLKYEYDCGMRMPMYAEVMSAKHTYTDEQVARVEAQITAHKDVFTKLHQLVRMPPLELTADATLDYHWSSAVREASRMIVTESYLLALQGQYQDAIENQADGLQIAKQLTHVGMRGYYTGTACQNITLAGFRSILQLAGDKPGVAAAIRAKIEGLDQTVNLASALETEIATMEDDYAKSRAPNAVIVSQIMSHDFGTQQFEVDPNAPSEVSVKLSKDERQFWNNLVDACEAKSLLRQRAAIAAAKLPEGARRDALAKLRNECAAADTTNPVNAMSLPSFPVTGQYAMPEFSYLPCLNELVACAAAWALDQHTKTEEFPASLPDAYEDPYTNKPLIYEHTAAGFKIATAEADEANPDIIVRHTNALMTFTYPGVPTPLTVEQAK